MAVDNINESAVASFIQDANQATNFGSKRAVVDAVNTDKGTIHWHVESKAQRLVRFFVPNTTKRQNQQFAQALASFKDSALHNENGRINQFVARVHSQPKLGSTNPLKLFNTLPAPAQPGTPSEPPTLSARNIRVATLDQPTHTNPVGSSVNDSHISSQQSRTSPRNSEPNAQGVEQRSATVGQSGPVSTGPHLSQGLNTPPSENPAIPHQVDTTNTGIADAITRRSGNPPQTTVVNEFLRNTQISDAIDNVSDTTLEHRATQSQRLSTSQQSSEQTALLAEIFSALEAVQRLEDANSAGVTPADRDLEEGFVRLDALQQRFNQLQADSQDTGLQTIAEAIATLNTKTTALIGASGGGTAHSSTAETIPVSGHVIDPVQGISADEAYELIRSDYNSLLGQITTAQSSSAPLEGLLQVRDQINDVLEPAIEHYTVNYPADQKGATQLLQQLDALNTHLNQTTQRVLDPSSAGQTQSKPDSTSHRGSAKVAPTAGPHIRSEGIPSQPQFYREPQSQQYCSVAALNAFVGAPVLTKQAAVEALKNGWIADLPTDPDQIIHTATQLYGDDFEALISFTERFNLAQETHDQAQLAALREELALARFSKGLRFDVGRLSLGTINWDTPFTNAKVGGIPQGDVLRVARHSDIGKEWQFNAPKDFSAGTPLEIRREAFKDVDRAVVNRNGHWVTYRKTTDDRWFEVNSSDEKGRFSQPPKSIDPAEAIAGLNASVFTASRIQ